MSLCASCWGKNIKRAKARKKVWIEKRKEKNSKRKEKRSKKEHSIALLFVVPFVLSIFPLLPFILVSIHIYFTRLFITTHARNTYRPATRTSALNIYSILLSVTHLCAIYIYSFVCLLSSTYTSDRYRKRLLQSWTTSSRYPLPW